MQWTAGDSGSPEMHPGANCITCHSKGEGPAYLVAGTVYQAFHEPDNCYGVEGVVVQITDANGQVIKLTTNKAGNYTVRTKDGAIAMPFHAKVIFQGKERMMMGAKGNGNCANCHTMNGANGAPGRVIIPSG
jgi:hypothetical protein